MTDPFNIRSEVRDLLARFSNGVPFEDLEAYTARGTAILDAIGNLEAQHIDAESRAEHWQVKAEERLQDVAKLRTMLGSKTVTVAKLNELDDLQARLRRLSTWAHPFATDFDFETHGKSDEWKAGYAAARAYVADHIRRNA